MGNGQILKVAPDVWTLLDRGACCGPVGLNSFRVWMLDICLHAQQVEYLNFKLGHFLDV